MSEDKNSKKGGFLAAGIIGGLIGAAMGILFAPKSGKETRKSLMRWAQQMSEEVESQVKDAKEMTQDKYEKIVDMVTDKYRKAQDIKESELDDFAKDLKKRWSRIKDQWNE